MSDRRVALLRGINVGKAKRVAMAALRKLFEDLGYGDVHTLLNSGNVVLHRAGKASRSVCPDRAGHRRPPRGLDSCHRSRRERGGGSPSCQSAGLGRDLPGPVPARRAPGRPERRSLEAARQGELGAGSLRDPQADRVPWCPKGSPRSPLWIAVNRATGDAGTARNLATMTKLLTLFQSPIVPQEEEMTRRSHRVLVALGIAVLALGCSRAARHRRPR